MITTVTLNAAIDKTYFVSGFAVGRANRVDSLLLRPGGKGINVARVVKTLGAEALASGFTGGNAGRWIEEELARLGLATDFVRVGGESRTTLVLVDRAAGNQTELREPSPDISPREAGLMLDKVKHLAERSRVIVFSGSLPSGLPAGFYGDLVTAAKGAGALTILDTSGAPLAKGLEAGPYLIKPNEEELGDLEVKQDYGAGEDVRRIVGVSRRWVERGLSLVVVSLGAAGLVAVTEKGAWSVRPPRLSPVNTVGCGDALVAGCAVVFDRSPQDLVREAAESVVLEALRLGTAAAASAALQPCAGEVDLSEVARFLNEVSVERVA
ncbi:MAG: 1-phosphofructokinase family hexose kinase [Bacillota bacterium]|nr:1-phosphofructokinase family hexose kinase [Bacillota bacterium]